MGIGIGASRFAGPNGVSFNPANGGKHAADAIAHALGVDPKKLHNEAAAKARAAGFCKLVCSPADIKKWAKSLPPHERAKLSPALKAYTDAYAGRSKAFHGGEHAAAAAGFCGSDGCSAAELKRYAIKMGDSLPGNLGKYAKAFAGRTATPMKGILGHRLEISPSAGKS